MANFAATASVAITSTLVTSPNKSADFLKLRNMDTGTNVVWVCLDNTTTAAVAEADEHEAVGPGESILLPWKASYYMIAVGGTTKVNVVAAAGRI